MCVCVFFNRRGSRYVLWNAERLCAHMDVRLLFPGGAWAVGAAVSLVEEIPDDAAISAVRVGDTPLGATVIYRLRLPASDCLVRRNARGFILFLVQSVLQRKI